MDNGHLRRGPTNPLHAAAAGGSLQGVLFVLSSGSIDINQGNPQGLTPLIIAAARAHTGIVSLLLQNGASVSSVSDEGTTALHTGCMNGHRVVCQVLIKAGSNLEAKTFFGYTCLHLSAENGHTEVIKLLIEAGESPDSRLPDGRTPLHMAAAEGNVGAIRELLRGRANPLLTVRATPVNTYVPLDLAVRHGRVEVVRDLIQRLGLAGCAGASGGKDALRLAAQNDHLCILSMLTEAGVEDDGSALIGAIGYAREAPVKYLLHRKKRATGSTTAYANTLGKLGDFTGTPLLVAIGYTRHQPVPRIVQLLIKAGADTTSTVAIPERAVWGTPLEFVTRFIDERKVDGKTATKDQLYKLEAIRIQLLRVRLMRSRVWSACRSGFLCITLSSRHTKAALGVDGPIRSLSNCRVW